MSRVEATVEELASVQRRLTDIRTEIMRHAMSSVSQAGFVKTDEQAMAALMVLFGAAQRLALQSRQHFAIFKALAADMAASEADAVIQRSVMELGPETEEMVTPGGIILPGSGGVQ